VRAMMHVNISMWRKTCFPYRSTRYF